MNKKTKTKIRGAAKFYANHALELAKGDCPDDQDLRKTYMDYSLPSEWEESFCLDWESSEGENPTDEMNTFFHSCMGEEADKVLSGLEKEDQPEEPFPREVWVLRDLNKSIWENTGNNFIWYFKTEEQALEYKEHYVKTNRHVNLVGPFRLKKEE